MVAQAIQIVHCLPGRVRAKFSRLKGDAALAREMQHTLAAIEGIQHVEVSPTTGSVLVVYDLRLPEWLNMEAVGPLMGLADTLGLSLEDMDTEELQSWLCALRNGAHPETSTTLESGVGTIFGSVNSGVARVASRWSDLRTLIPLTLCFLGFRSLLLAEQVAFPTWYDYLWFAFGTYVALHPSRPAQE